MLLHVQIAYSCVIGYMYRGGEGGGGGDVIMSHHLASHHLVIWSPFQSTIHPSPSPIPPHPIMCPCSIPSHRCVADEQRTLALGLQSIIFCVFGNIPGPLLFGAIFDSACTLWQYNCGSKGECWVYSNSDISYRAVGLGLSGAFLTFLFSFFTWAVYPRTSGEEEGAGVTGKVDMSGEDEVEEGGLAERPPRRISTTRFDSYRSDDVLLDVTNGRGTEEESSVDAGCVANGDKGQQVHISEGDGGTVARFSAR